MLDSNLKNYNENGFVIFKNGITENLILRIHQDIEQLLFEKFPEYKKLFSNENVNLRIPKLLSKAEGDNPELFYKLCVDCTKLASFSMIGISEDFRELLLYLLENDPKKVFTFGSNGIFLNKKNVTRLKYEWHQEKSYYPNHNFGIHIWFPLFNSIQKTGGPMLIKKNTHYKDFDYERIVKDKTLEQRKISEKKLTEYEVFECNLDLGDVIIFDHRVVHCTADVISEEIPRISGIKRYVAI